MGGPRNLHEYFDPIFGGPPRLSTLRRLSNDVEPAIVGAMIQSASEGSQLVAPPTPKTVYIQDAGIAGQAAVRWWNRAVGIEVLRVVDDPSADITLKFGADLSAPLSEGTEAPGEQLRLAVTRPHRERILLPRQIWPSPTL